ncbi:MAG: hypothetical protein COB49_06235 [Alphaproteobacteria bacterium]|nr:MAG: hypothetical protein COB49_06235 [Alphaproteobacteria bacterium]
MNQHGTVIIGGGNAGFQVADTLRKGGYDGPVTLLCAEKSLPYQRPPLSKKFLAGDMAEERLLLRPAKYYDDRNITVIRGCEVTGITLDEKQVQCADGRHYEFDKLVFATGARVRRLPMEGASGLLYLRTSDDVKSISKAVQNIDDVLLIGGGFIGLEVAATLRGLGKSVTVVEAMPTIMPNVVGAVLAEYFTGYHRSSGTKIITNTAVETIERLKSGRYSVCLSDGSTRKAGAVIVGIGVIPNSELAAGIGLEVGRGIIVDEYGCTATPDVFAAGDCAHGVNLWVGGPVHLESVQNAVDQAITVGKSILGEKLPYETVPWFWSDQYDLKLQMAGLSRGHDSHVVRGSLADNRFSICYFSKGSLIAVDSVNRPADHLGARKLLAARTKISPAQGADIETPLKAFLTK